MRQLDRRLGVPVCAALTLHRRLFRRRREPPDPVRRILFVKLAEQGSTVLAWPAIRNAIELVGRENVFFLVFEENRHILDVMDVIAPENVITISTNGLFGVLAGAISALKRIRSEQIDAAVDLEFFARSSAALTYLSGARRRVGFHAAAGEAGYRGDLMTHRLSYNPFLHTSQTFVTMLEALKLPGEQLPAFDLVPPPAEESLPQFRPGQDELDQVRGLLRTAWEEDDAAPLILLNANAGDMLPLRRWPGERYVELARRLIEKYPELRVAFTGGQSETDAAEKLTRQVASERCVCLAGKTTLRQLVVLYTLAEVLVTNDSGPAHFAALTDIDAVTLFGPETPHLFAARTPRNHVLWASLACSPCVNAYNGRQSPCRDNLCMQDIIVDQVFETVCSLYEARSPQRS